MTAIGIIICILVVFLNGYVISHHRYNEGEVLKDRGGKNVEITAFMGYGLYQGNGTTVYREKELMREVEYEYMKWKEETVHQPNNRKIFDNDHFKRIVEIGDTLFIIEKIKKKPDLIVHALPLITRRDDVEGQTLEDYCKAWIKLYS